MIGKPAGPWATTPFEKRFLRPGAGSGTNHWRALTGDAPCSPRHGVLAAAGCGLPTASAIVRSANGLSSEGSPGLNLVLPSSMRAPIAYFMSVAVWYSYLVRMDDDGRVIIGRYVEQAAEVIATRNAMLNGITTGVSGLRSVEWQPKLLSLQGRDDALGLAAESLQAFEHVVDVLLASFHGSFWRGPDKPKLLLMTPSNDTHDSVYCHFIGGQVDEAWPDVLQDVLLVHLFIAWLMMPRKRHVPLPMLLKREDVTPRIASGEQRELTQVMQGEDFLSSGQIGDQRSRSSSISASSCRSRPTSGSGAKADTKPSRAASSSVAGRHSWNSGAELTTLCDRLPPGAFGLDSGLKALCFIIRINFDQRHIPEVQVIQGFIDLIRRQQPFKRGTVVNLHGLVPALGCPVGPTRTRSRGGVVCTICSSPQWPKSPHLVQPLVRPPRQQVRYSRASCSSSLVCTVTRGTSSELPVSGKALHDILTGEGLLHGRNVGGVDALHFLAISEGVDNPRRSPPTMYSATPA